jgi:hypothetical protein
MVFLDDGLRLLPEIITSANTDKIWGLGMFITLALPRLTLYTLGCKPIPVFVYQFTYEGVTLIPYKGKSLSPGLCTHLVCFRPLFFVVSQPPIGAWFLMDS